MSNLFSQESESFLLAAILRYPDEYWSINSVGLTPSDFIGTENIRVMKAIASVAADKRIPDLPLVLEEVRVSGRESTAEYVQKLLEVPCSIAQAHEHARTIKGLSASRALANAGARIIEVARENRADYEAAISEADTLLWKVKQVLPPEERGTSAADIIERMKNAPPSQTIPINWSPKLQDWTMGYAPGMFWVVGGFSSVGKSALAVNMAIDGLRARKSVGIVSVEMTAEQYMLRFQSVLSGVSQRALRQGVMLPFDNLDRLERARSSLARSNLDIVDNIYKLDKIRSKAIKLKETRGLDLLFVDFLQNVVVTGDEFGDARNVALDLQNLAKELSCTVVGFSQVSNEMAKRDADGADRNYYSFKGHGAIRDAADVAIMLRRDRVSQSPILNLSVVKNRHDQLGEIPCLMELETGRITELAEEE